MVNSPQENGGGKGSHIADHSAAENQQEAGTLRAVVAKLVGNLFYGG